MKVLAVLDVVGISLVGGEGTLVVAVGGEGILVVAVGGEGILVVAVGRGGGITTSLL